MKTKTMAFSFLKIGIRIWLSGLIIVLLAALAIDQQQSWANITVDSLLNCTNTIRETEGRSPLRLHPKLKQAAQAKLVDMERYRYWAHQNPQTGTMPWDFIKASGYHYLSAGENLAIGFQISEAVCQAWKNSHPHLANLIDERFQEVGFAAQKVDLGTRKGVLIVQHFGERPDATAPEPPSTSIEASLFEDKITNPFLIIFTLIALYLAIVFQRTLRRKKEKHYSKAAK